MSTPYHFASRTNKYITQKKPKPKKNSKEKTEAESLKNRTSALSVLGNTHLLSALEKPLI